MKILNLLSNLASSSVLQSLPVVLQLSAIASSASIWTFESADCGVASSGAVAASSLSGRAPSTDDVDDATLFRFVRRIITSVIASARERFIFKWTDVKIHWKAYVCVFLLDFILFLGNDQANFCARERKGLSMVLLWFLLCFIGNWFLFLNWMILFLLRNIY